MNRFERHPVLTLLTTTLVLLAALVAMAEWLLSPPAGRHLVAGNESSLQPARFLKLREWEPNTRYLFGPPETRVANSQDEVPEVYVLEADGAGFIAPSVVHDEPDAEIVFVGGSTTECLYIMPENRFAHAAARLLEARLDLRINGINAGKSGNNTMHSLLATIGKVLPRRPDFVVLMQATNDVGVLNRFGTYWNENPDFALIGREERSIETVFKDLRDVTVPHTYRRLRRALRTMAEAGPVLGTALAATGEAAAPEAEAPGGRLGQKARMGRDFESALRSFVAVVRAWHSQPVLMTQVVVRESGGDDALEGAYLSEEALATGRFTPESFADAHGYFNAIIRQVALSERVPLIDLAKARAWSDRDVYDGIHFNDPGSLHVAEVVAEAMAPLIAGLPR